MENPETIQIRLLEKSDPPSIATAFKRMGWKKLETQYQRYFPRTDGGNSGLLRRYAIDGQFAGYVTVNWRPTYAGFADLTIPEIQDLNVLTTYRRKVSQAACWTAQKRKQPGVRCVVGIGVGLHPGYNAAQRLYVKRGYIPDGRGITYRGCFLQEGASVVLDDDLVMHFTKQLRAE